MLNPAFRNISIGLWLFKYASTAATLNEGEKVMSFVVTRKTLRLLLRSSNSDSI
ncbi:hypothetical protein D3C78_1716610 [compost metagenome]